MIETHRTSVRDFAAPFGRVAHLDAGIASATTLCGLFGRSWDAVSAARGEDAILDHLAQILIAANDLECAVFASRIAERAASQAAAGWLR